MSLLTLGSDMEVFAVDKDGHHVALCGKIGGTKTQPLQLSDMDEGFMVQEDNVALEFNIPVCTTKKEFIYSFAIMREKIALLLKTQQLLVSTEASVSFDKMELTHPNALIFGCEPDYSAWSMCENDKPFSKNEFLRTAGGHIHVGSDMDMVKGVQNMDLFIGVPSILLDDKPSSIARRELYGKAGAMRPKPYGWEYRVISNYWMFSDALVGWIYDQTKRACNANRNLSERQGKEIQHCINTGDKYLANKLVADYGLSLPY